jgi:30S ribosomal protein 3
MEKFKIDVLWLEDSIGFSINQRILQHSLPLTTYYFWPMTDAWEQIELELDSKPWFCKEDKSLILNSITKAINIWQNSRRFSNRDRLIECKKISSKNVSIIGLP